ncbi:MAG: hypothetical protein OXK81_10010 [Chloroflexota bacterium]|nr:hypothetical protein [Chloroflexota bacterium]MDE2932068.1 hypothetical protein [Chloroflexota bacterium]
MRKVLAVILGVLVANVVFFLGSLVANALYPTPPELMDPQTPEATALRVAAAETNSLTLLILGGALGGFLGGIVGAKIARDRTFAVTSAIGALLAPWAIYSFYVFFPARLWFPIGMLVAFLLSTYLGGIVARRTQVK